MHLILHYNIFTKTREKKKKGVGVLKKYGLMIFIFCMMKCVWGGSKGGTKNYLRRKKMP